MPDPSTDIETKTLLERLATIGQADRDSARTILHQAIDAVFLVDQPGVLLRAVLSALFTLSLTLNTELIRLALPQTVKGKARPRLGGYKGGKRAIMPEDYLAWLDEAKFFLFEQWRQRVPLQQVHTLVIRFIGGDRSIDADNGAGSVMDAMVGAGIVRQDNMSVIPWLDVKWEPTLKGVEPRIEIYLDPAEKPHDRFLKPARKSKPKVARTAKRSRIPEPEPTPVVSANQQRQPKFVATAREPGRDPGIAN